MLSLHAAGKTLDGCLVEKDTQGHRVEINKDSFHF